MALTYPDLTQWGTNDSVTGGASGNLNTRLEVLFQTFSNEVNRDLRIQGDIGIGGIDVANQKLTVVQTVAAVAVVFAIDASATGASTTNVAGNFASSGATNNIAVRASGGQSVFSNSEVLPQTTAQLDIVQVLGTTAATSALAIGSWSATTNPSIDFIRSRNATIGSATVVVTADVLGEIVAYGDDGTDFATPAARIRFLALGTIGASQMPGAITFATTSNGAGAVTEALRIDNGQRFLIGQTASLTTGNSITARMQLYGVDTSTASLVLGRFSGDNAGPYMQFLKSRNATIGSSTIVNSGDVIGRISWAADDGTDFISEVAAIEALISTTPGANDTPGAIRLLVSADGSQVPTERGRVDHNGNWLIGGATSPSTAVSSLSLFNGTAPTAAAADSIVIYSSDRSAGNTMLSLWLEGTGSIETGVGDAVADKRVHVRINGTDYAFLVV